MRKDLWELKRGVAAVLAKGDHGKGGVSATSFEHTQEKMTDEILQRMRDMKEQIADVKSYVTNFEFHMGEEFLATFETLDKRVDVVLRQHAKMKEHLVEVQARREQHANEIKAAIAAAEAQSRQRDLMIIDMIQQVAKKQGLMLSLVPPVQVSVPAPQVPASNPSRSPSYSPSRRRPTRAGVGLKVGNIQESLINGRRCHYMIVQGLVAGSAAESSGNVRAGDAILSIDEITLGGMGVTQAKFLFFGLEGTAVNLRLWRPETNSEFELTLYRMVSDDDLPPGEQH